MAEGGGGESSSRPVSPDRQRRISRRNTMQALEELHGLATVSAEAERQNVASNFVDCIRYIYDTWNEEREMAELVARRQREKRIRARDKAKGGGVPAVSLGNAAPPRAAPASLDLSAEPLSESLQQNPLSPLGHAPPPAGPAGGELIPPPPPPRPL